MIPACFHIVATFQSTLPRRERHLSSTIRYFLFKFQSTLPRRERLHTLLIPGSMVSFQSTLPRRERPIKNMKRYITTGYFNPRSREGSDANFAKDTVKQFGFQSTLPRRERPHKQRNQLIAAVISIHAPAKGATVR